MKTTGEFTLHRHEINFKKYGEPVYLIPFGDIHRSSKLCHVEKWKEFLVWAKKKKNCHFIGMGDYFDLASTSERPSFNNPTLHNDTIHTLEDVYTDMVEDFAKEIGFMKGRLIGLVEGNHYAVFSSGITTTQLLCQKLGCKYLGVSSFIKLILRYDKLHSHAVDMWAHHGLGGGRTSGASINKLEQMIKMAEAQIYLMGHDHRKQVSLVSKLALSDSKSGLRLHNKKILLGRTGSFLRGYVDGKASYVADGAYPPTDLGVIKIELTPRRSSQKINKVRVEDRQVDIHASL